MDQPIEGECLQNGWIYQQIIEMVEHNKAEYEKRHDRKEPVGKEKTENVEPGLPDRAG